MNHLIYYRMIDKIDTLSFKILIDFLEIQEYVQFLTISKGIFNQAKQYIELRQPCIIVINRSWGEFGISEQCLEEMRLLAADRNARWSGERSCPFLVRAILRFGSARASDLYVSLGLHAFPRMFSQCIKITEYDGSESPNIYEWVD